MKFQRLRLMGFKSFADDGNLLIEKGLTGVVGPNGCGKSNLVEALRWVMGESSYKAMRGSGMDDVIFSGNQKRAPKMNAQVSVLLDNRTRRAPAGFNSEDEIEISRRIERGAGSVFRVNGKEVRAKDVHLLFADASTGARSNALVRQGQISELISQKPQNRRRILEEAAGISGLHTRRHEAELRLKAAEQNLDRLDDVMTELEGQLETLKRQARQATRYRNISADIRSCEAALFHLRWIAGIEARDSAHEAFLDAQSKVNGAASHQAETAKNAAIAAQKLPELRENSASLQAAVQRVSLELQDLDQEDARIAARESELVRLLSQIENDEAREKRILDENSNVMDSLKSESQEIAQALAASAKDEKDLIDRVAQENERLAGRESELTDLRQRLAESRARRNALEEALLKARANLERAAKAKSNAIRDHAALSEDAGHGAAITRLEEQIETFKTRLEAHDNAHRQLEENRNAVSRTVEDSKAAVSEARARLSALETEVKTLESLLDDKKNKNASKRPAVLEAITVKEGYERAVAAAFGENLNAPILEEGEDGNSAEALYWLTLPEIEAVALPGAATPLSDFVDGPDALKRRLAHIGLVEDEQGAALQAQLKAGQILVSVAGNRWAWDGFTQKSNAPTVSAQKLANRNRLSGLKKTCKSALKDFETHSQDLKSRNSDLAAATEALNAEIKAKRQCETALHNGHQQLMKLEKEAAEQALLLEAARQAVERCDGLYDEAQSNLRSAEEGLADLKPNDELERDVQGFEDDLQKERQSLAGLTVARDGFAREKDLRVKRRAAIEHEIDRWISRGSEARNQLENLEKRRNDISEELTGLADAPNEIAEKRRGLVSTLSTQKEAAAQAVNILQNAERNAATTEAAAKEALSRLSQTKEDIARTEERLSAAKAKIEDLAAQIADTLDAAPGQLFALAGLKEDAPLPDADALDRKLHRLKAERERLGGVNLMADKEADTLTERRDTLLSEHEDLVHAINQLRGAIGSINRESRQRLTASFDTVNAHFKTLFSRLFNGGEATLELVGSDDMLEAGLEIVAQPPGKKPQTLSLLSGGEQALTAMALIFAVFLTNPSPICVLDEVDAPLDDANVERLCDLLHDMTQETDTRFLMITHNPLTMARMNRLFGVTMREKGVSQLVSVNLEEAEAMVEPKALLI